jgi:hypothetical protein
MNAWSMASIHVPGPAEFDEMMYGISLTGNDDVEVLGG